MKKFLLLVGLLVCITTLVYAQSASEVADQVAQELQSEGVITPQEAASVKSSVKTLVESGASVREAKNIVAQAAHQAKAQGLKGKELAAKVHEAVKLRKTQLMEAKKKAKEAKEKAEAEIKKKEKEVKEKTQKEGKKTKEKFDKATKNLNKKWGQ